MNPGSFLFDRYRLDVRNRRLMRDDVAMDLSPRYLDALTLLVREAGNLVSKDRFLDEVWRGVPVTEEALTQAIRTLRKQLGDDAAAPRFIETVPKHGYRFIAKIRTIADDRPPATDGPVEPELARLSSAGSIVLLGRVGTMGAGLAGAIGGLIYGLAEASYSSGPGAGGISVLLVFVCLTTVVALLGGAGVAFGIAVATSLLSRTWLWSVAGGAIGGLLVGALVKVLGVDAFNLLFGQSPSDFTGGMEGALIGGAAGLAAWPGLREDGLSARRAAVLAAVVVGAAGMLVPVIGGRMMGGSLEALALSFPDSRLHFGQLGGIFGDTGLGPLGQIITGGLEGALFGGCLVGAMVAMRRRMGG